MWKQINKGNLEITIVSYHKTDFGIVPSTPICTHCKIRVRVLLLAKKRVVCSKNRLRRQNSSCDLSLHTSGEVANLKLEFILLLCDGLAPLLEIGNKTSGTCIARRKDHKLCMILADNSLFYTI